jgi:hypothetical protein
MRTHHGINYDPTEFKIWYSPCSREVGRWTEEIKTSAKLLANSTNRDIWICMSGGIDSEVVANTFKDLGIPFRALIAQFPDKLNEHDIVYARRWCENNKIEYKIFNFDMLDFIKHGHTKYLKEGLVSNNIFRYFCIELLQYIEDINGFGILGGKSVGLRLAQSVKGAEDNTTIYDNYDIGSLAPIEWCHKNNLKHCLFFYQSTSEIHQAYLNDPINQMLINNPYMLRSSSANEAAKILMMRSHFPLLVPRTKHHGFEKIAEIRETAQKNMANYFGLDSITENKRYKAVFYNDQISNPVSQVLEQLHYEQINNTICP